MITYSRYACTNAHIYSIHTQQNTRTYKRLQTITIKCCLIELWRSPDIRENKLAISIALKIQKHPFSPCPLCCLLVFQRSGFIRCLGMLWRVQSYRAGGAVCGGSAGSLHSEGHRATFGVLWLWGDHAQTKPQLLCVHHDEPWLCRAVRTPR